MHTSCQTSNQSQNHWNLCLLITTLFTDPRHGATRQYKTWQTQKETVYSGVCMWVCMCEFQHLTYPGLVKYCSLSHSMMINPLIDDDIQCPVGYMSAMAQ